MLKKIVLIIAVATLGSFACAENLPGVYDFITYCPQSRLACGVILDQTPSTTEDDSPEYHATIWKGDRSQSKMVIISKTKYRQIDRLFQLKRLWLEMQKGVDAVSPLPKNDQILYFNAKNSKGEYHILIYRYSKSLTAFQKVVLNWETFLKAQVMRVNSPEFKQDFPKK